MTDDRFMFEILQKSLRAGVVTEDYPSAPPVVSAIMRGKPKIDFVSWKDARPASKVCPTNAIDCRDEKSERTVTLDLGKCVFCGMCAEVDTAIRMTNLCELAVSSKSVLQSSAKYKLGPDGAHEKVISISPDETVFADKNFDEVGEKLKKRIQKTIGRSLHIREVDAGSCNGCEIEIVGLSSPVYDIERFGIHFVASPRHADMLLVTGPVTRNMELALKKTYDAMPSPRLVVAVGACGCSGGAFGRNYATCGGVDRILPVDVYIPGCPPNPHALLHGILIAIGRWKERPKK